MRDVNRVLLTCVVVGATACSGTGGRGTNAAPAAPDTLAKLRTQLAAAVIASEASCSASWLSSRTEPPCAVEPRRALTAAHSWMLEREVLESVAAAATRDPVVKGLKSRLTRERAQRDATDARGVTAIAKALGYADAPALLSAIYGFDVRRTTAIAKELLNESEGLYLVARTDVGATTTEAEALTRKALPSAKTAEIARLLVDTVLPPPPTATVSSIVDAPSSSAGVFFVAPGEQRVVAALTGGALDVEQTGRALAASRVRQLLGEADASVAHALGFVAVSPVATPEWMASNGALAEPALTQVVRARAFLALEAARAEAARSLDTLALYDGAGSDLGAADPWMTALVRFRGRLLGANLISSIVGRLGPTWWQHPDAAAVFTELTGGADSETILARLKVRLSPDTLLVEAARTLARADALVTQR